MHTKTTATLKPAQIEKKWILVDAEDVVVGRLATFIAMRLRGKHRADYTPNMDCGDHVVVINARDIVVTGRKRTLKVYDRYSGYPGGRHERTYEEQMERDPTFPITHAVRGMLQHNTLGADMLKRLRVYAGPEHHHSAQQPKPITFGELGEIKLAST